MWTCSESQLKTHILRYLQYFFFLFAFYLAGQLFKMWYNQTAPIYIGYFKIDAHETRLLYTLAGKPVQRKKMVRVNYKNNY